MEPRYGIHSSAHIDEDAAHVAPTELSLPVELRSLTPH
jgi:hypothetical protein